jgi:hypothetical protein
METKPKPSQSQSQSLTDQIFHQCVMVLGHEENQKKLQIHLIDPLVTYFKQSMRYFFIIIIVILGLVLITNLFIIAQMFISWRHHKIQVGYPLA